MRPNLQAPVRQRALAIALAAALAATLAGCGKPGAGGPSAAASGASAAKAAAPVLLLAPEDLLTLQPSRLASGPVISGSLQPERRADLRAEVAAVVLQVMKENGDTVNAGDTLMKLDDTAIRDSLSSAEEALRASTQAFEQVERQVARLKTLQAQGMTSTQALEDAEVRRNNAQSDLVAARARVVSARQQMARTVVRAPFAGVVSERKASVGDTVQVGRELVKVIDPRSMRFEGLVSADRMHELKLGQPVSFRVNGFAQGDFTGKVQRIEAAANAVTRQVEVIVAFATPAQAPRVAGLFAEGRVETGGTEGLSLPGQAVVRSGELAHAWKLNGNSLSKVALRLGERDPRTGESPVLSGLVAGDRILRAPGSSLVDGQKFEFAKPLAAAGAAPSAVAATASAAK
ncbi:efflux RND transporter periplasmic adaptor subunit [Rubrivivax rivuli]|uniref:Efflux RND transporter periplasmic adaptor subunit n=1 Tax=Rubrivivax rivuli TaxID=1862385 RepID=A0A437RHU5_9BURK|nr:efflux RND transporter periplasmic adaptor subunit [Rubrivivax rivuli]RVU46248.1 efflux RND transporter periplasmic adaptor subunit [Rubrivivax rivuli]